MKKQSTSSQSLGSLSLRYQVLAIVLYTGALLMATFSWFSGRPPSAPLLNQAVVARFIIIAMVILIMLLLDLYAVRRYQLQLPTATKWLHLVIRVSLVMLAFAIAGLEDVIFIYLPLSLYAYLTMGRNTGIAIAIMGLIVVFLHLAFGPRNNFISFSDFERLLSYCITATFALLLGNMISREAKGKEQNRQLLDELSDSHQRLEESMTQIAELAATEERNRMARDIHDGLGHHLAAINVQLEMAIKLFEQQPVLAKEAAAQAKTATQAALNDVRESVSTLREGSRKAKYKSVEWAMTMQRPFGKL